MTIFLGVLLTLVSLLNIFMFFAILYLIKNVNILVYNSQNIPRLVDAGNIIFKKLSYFLKNIHGEDE